MERKPMQLEVHNIRKQFKNGTLALDRVDFQVERGEFVSVIGPSGAGKTTLFRILNGTLDCDEGSVLIGGSHLETAKGQKKRGIQKTIATIYQDFCLVENLTCLENVLNACLPDMAFFPAVLGLFGRAREAEARGFLERVGLSEKENEPVKNLSGGQKQRTAIARALMRHPAILLADEPAASLDPVTGRQILELLKDIQNTERLTILMNSHNLPLSMEFSDRLIGLKNGRAVFDKSAASITDDILTELYGSAKKEGPQ